MKKIYFLFTYVLLFSLLVIILHGNTCQAQPEIIDIANAYANTYFWEVEAALDGFSWCVGDQIYEFETHGVRVEPEYATFWDIKERKRYTIYPRHYDMYIADGPSEEFKYCAYETLNLLDDDKLKTALDNFVKDGGGYIGRCGSSIGPPSFYVKERKPNSYIEYLCGHLNSWLGDDAPNVKAYIKSGYPFYSQFLTYQTWWITGPFPWPKIRIPWNDEEAAGAVGLQAYRKWWGVNDFNGVCHNIIVDDNSHAILKDYWGDTLYTNTQSGGFGNDLPNDVSVLFRYPEFYEGDENYRLDKWIYKIETKNLLDIVIELKNLIKYYLFEDDDGSTLGNSIWDTFFKHDCWYRLKDKHMITDVEKNPAIIAFEYQNEGGGRIVLSGPHVATDVWDKDAKLVNQPFDDTQNQGISWYTTENKNHNLEGFYYWALNPGTEDETVVETDFQNEDSYWYQRREAAWAAGIAMMISHLHTVDHMSLI